MVHPALPCKFMPQPHLYNYFESAVTGCMNLCLSGVDASLWQVCDVASVLGEAPAHEQLLNSLSMQQTFTTVI